MNAPGKVYLIGCGGHAKVVLSTLVGLGHTVEAVFDDDPARWGERLAGAPIVGPVDRILQHPALPAVITVGDNEVRKRLAERLPLEWLTVVDRHAVVDRSARLGPGTVVLGGAVIQADARLGRHVIVNTAATVDHDCQVGDFAHLAPGVHLAGGVIVGERALVGIGAVATPKRRIGAAATVGAGAVVARDLAPGVVAAGVPARVLRPDAAGSASGATGGLSASAQPRIYLSPPHMSGRERELLLDAFDSNWIAPLGPHVDALEREFAANLGLAQSVALSSGTAALHLALLLLGVGPGDEVITSTLTFAATANAITYVGARPVFVDSERATWNIDPALLADELDELARRGRRPKAVLAVDLFGQCADYGPILEACGRHEVPLVEDAAEALGASYRGKPAGTFGLVGCFSLNGNKIITAGGGGLLASDRKDLCEKARFLATQARDPAPHYEHSQIGYNYRMSNLLAAVARGQLELLDARVCQRRANFGFYREALGDLPGLDFMPEDPQGRSTRWLTCATVDPHSFGATRDELLAAFQRHDVEARPVWKPMHVQPVFAGCRARGGAVAEDLFRRGLCLPSGSNLTDAERSRVVDVIRSLARRSYRKAA